MSKDDRRWLPAEDENLRALVAQRWTASKIGEVLGCSRNAILGRIHRLGLTLNSDSPRNTAKKLTAPPPFLPVDKTPLRVPINAPPPLNLSVLELTNLTCRWPVTDDKPHTFCGNPSQGRYCAFHERLNTPPKH